MKNIKLIIALSSSIILLASCNSDNNKSDAYGNFETTEIIISAESNGKIIQFDVNEGDVLDVNQKIGFIDTLALVLNKKQIEAQKQVVSSKATSILSQIKVIEEQKTSILVEKQRVEKLLKDGAATTKMLDDINGQLNVLESQISSIRTQNSSILNEIDVLEKQIDIINEKIIKSYIINPIQGTVIEKYAEVYEIATIGKKLYKISDLSEMELRAYISGNQLTKVKVGQELDVIIDGVTDDLSKIKGVVSWVSNEAEFTPKIIQTKEERVNLVYAVKVRVKNDGSIKIGMPGEVVFE